MSGLCLARAFETAYRLGLIEHSIHADIPPDCSSDRLPELCVRAGAVYHPKGAAITIEGGQPVIAILWERGGETAHALFTFDLAWLNEQGCLPHGVHSIVTFKARGEGEREQNDRDGGPQPDAVE